MKQTAHDGTQLRDILRAAIEEGEYPPCTALPSEAELAERYGMQESVRNALESLTNEGLLKRGSAKNYYVQSRKMERDLDKLQGFTQTMLDKNITPSFKIISRKIRNAGMKYSFIFMFLQIILRGHTCPGARQYELLQVIDRPAAEIQRSLTASIPKIRIRKPELRRREVPFPLIHSSGN